ncbi:hypothetical protein [Arthrobacter sp. AL12]|uniref:hypothetical protein n=1 Tax=Arthrobacter sp. AL12 TaxID=3042241 RepID=UPI00249AFFAB|nr:hypothetical protein [Arthrobacter sp. AL12]MDI3211061.1 hypothetical protein [Arthrobacter sp. AL12]
MATLTQSRNPELQTFTEHLGGSGGVDAALLTLPVRNVIGFDDPRKVATAEAVAEGLDVGNGLLYGYLPEVSPDGLPGGEGAFLLCAAPPACPSAGGGSRAPEARRASIARAGPGREGQHACPRRQPRPRSRASCPGSSMPSAIASRI